MQGEPLVVEDLLLLMLDDKWGSPAGAGTIHYTLGGAILADLVLQGRIDIDTGRMGWNGPTVVVTAKEGDPLADPLLRDAEEKIARRPRASRPISSSSARPNWSRWPTGLSSAGSSAARASGCWD